MIPGLVIDSFAGGGGASTGIEMAFERAFEQGLLHERRYVDFAINHDAEAISMHAVNHPNTRHLPCNVWQVEFDELAAGKPVAFMWFSPDCKHFSKAKGGKPVKKNIRDLAWVVVKAARQVRPAVIMLENVEEFQGWGPLVFRVDETTGEVMRDPKTGAEILMPCPKRKGETFKRWMAELRRLGYRIEWRELRACDYGAPTIRKRFFMIARRDGRRIVWPAPTHGDPKSEAVRMGELKPWRTAAEIIDWSLECPSIFLTPDEVEAHLARTGQRVNRPLADATMQRVAKGVDRYVIKAEKPFIVSLTHQGGDRNEPVDEPMNTVTGAHRGEKAVVAPVYVGVGGRAGQSPPRGGDMPLGTLTAKADGAIITPTFVSYAQQGGGNRGADEPLHTATASDGDQNQVVAPLLASVPSFDEWFSKTKDLGGSREEYDRLYGPDAPVWDEISAPHLTKFRANSVGSEAGEPVPTVTANSFIERPGGAAPIGVVAPVLTRVAHGERDKSGKKRGRGDHAVAEPLPTQMASPEFSLVAPHLMTMRNAGKPFNEADKPTHTVTSMGAHLHLVAAFLAQHNISRGEGHSGHAVTDPVSTILHTGSHQGMAAVHMMDMHGSGLRDFDATEPLRALTAGGFHAAQVAAFLVKYYGADQDPRLDEPLHTATAKHRFGLVTVEIQGQPYIIVDIGLRMLVPRELFRAQGFPESYIIDRGADGKPLTKTAQVRMCGNSVCPQVAEALVWANVVQDTGSYVRRAEQVTASMETMLWVEERAA